MSAAMPLETWTAHIYSWRLDSDALLSLAQMSQGGLLVRAARIMCGVVKRQSEIDAAAARADVLCQQELELGLAQKSEAQSGAKKVKISTFADQSNDQEVTELIEDQILEAFTIFKGSGWCSQPLGNQSSCMGLGTSKPGKILEGVSCGMHMLAQVSVSTLDAYRDLMFHCSRRYGQVVWVKQYQADVRAVLEQLERLRRKGAAGAILIPNHTFSSAKPWEWCFRQFVDESAGFWRREPDWR